MIAADTGFGPVRQIAYLVDDLESAVAEWVTRHRAGPFWVRRHIPVAHAVVRGVTASFDHSSAYGQWGDVMVELLVIHGPERSSLRAHGALHHLACFVESLGRTLDGRDDVALLARSSATQFAFLDATATLGHYWELYEPSERLLGFYDFVRAASIGWDGTDPMRELS